MKKLSLMVAAAIFSTAMFANTPSPVKAQDGKSSKPSKTQMLKKQKPVKKTASAVTIQKEASKVKK